MELIICISVLLILLFSSINILKYLTPRKVLGISTGGNIEEIIESENYFWGSFLNKNPDYIPGWMAVGRRDIVEKIDPNYFIQK